MTWQFTPLAFLYLFAAGIGFTAAWLLRHRRELPELSSLSRFLLATGTFALAGALELAVVETGPKALFFKIENTSMLIAVVFMLIYVSYRDYPAWLSPLNRVVLGVMTALWGILIWTDAWHGLIYPALERDPHGDNMLIYHEGLLFWPFVAWLLALACLSAILLALKWVQSSGPERFDRASLTIGVSLPLMAYAYYLAGPEELPGRNLIPIAFSLTGLIIAGSTFINLERQVGENVATLRETIEHLEKEITARRAVEDRLRRSEEERRKLEVDRLRSELLANVSHELRTPLGLILLTTTLLIEQDQQMDHATRVGFLRDVEAETQQLRALVDNLLDLTRLNSGRMRLNCHLTDLARLAQDAVTRLIPELETHPIKVEMPADPLNAFVDGPRIEQVLRNLLVNAAKYSPPGAALTIHGVTRAADVLMGVSDRGIGIATEDLEPIFERFYRVRNAFTQQTPGAGLGLAICRGIIQAHGGRIWVESQVGAGSTFFFTVPLEKTNDE